MEVNVQNVLIRSEYGTAKRCFMIFMDRFKPKGERTEKDGDGIHQPRIQVLLSLTCCMSLNPKVYQITTISNHIQPYPTISNRTIVAPRVFQRPLHRLHIDTHGFLLVRHRSMPRTAAEHCHDQSNTPSIFSVYSCVNIVYVYTYIHIHTYITLHYITLHYITLHYIALHCITLHSIA